MLVHRLLQLGRVALLLAVAAAVAYIAVHEWDSVRSTIARLSWRSLLAAVAAVIVGMLATVRSWQHVLAAMGVELPYRQAAEVNLVGQLGKYLPGSVWAFALQAQLSKRYGLRRSKSLITLLLSAGVTTVTALTLAIFAAPQLATKWGAGAWLLLLGPLALLTLIPRVLTWIANLALRVIRLPRLESTLSGNQIARAIGWSVASWVCYGTHLWLLTGALARQSFDGWVVATGAFALAMSAGFIAFVLPSGIGVREAVLVAALAPVAAGGPALAIALCSRLLFTIADVVSAVGAFVIGRSARGETAG